MKPNENKIINKNKKINNDVKLRSNFCGIQKQRRDK